MAGKRVKLTLQQAEQVEWALGPMGDRWCSEGGAEERDGEVYGDESLPVLGPDGTRQTTRILLLSEVEEINEDLLYRLEEQLPDMERQAGHSGFDGKGAAKAALNAAARIRAAIKYDR